MRQSLEFFDSANDFGAVDVDLGGDGFGALGTQVEERFDEITVDEIARGIALAAKSVTERPPVGVLESADSLNVLVHRRLQTLGELVDILGKAGQDADDAVTGAEQKGGHL